MAVKASFFIGLYYMETLIGSTQCPTIHDYIGEEPFLCSETADVYELDPDVTYGRAFKCVCAQGHEHMFGEYYLPNVTLL